MSDDFTELAADNLAKFQNKAKINRTFCDPDRKISQNKGKICDKMTLVLGVHQDV